VRLKLEPFGMSTANTFFMETLFVTLDDLQGSELVY
jgi:hypothetical protein